MSHPDDRNSPLSNFLGEEFLFLDESLAPNGADTPNAIEIHDLPASDPAQNNSPLMQITAGAQTDCSSINTGGGNPLDLNAQQESNNMTSSQLPSLTGQYRHIQGQGRDENQDSHDNQERHGSYFQDMSGMPDQPQDKSSEAVVIDTNASKRFRQNSFQSPVQPRDVRAARNNRRTRSIPFGGETMKPDAEVLPQFPMEQRPIFNPNTAVKRSPGSTSTNSEQSIENFPIALPLTQPNFDANNLAKSPAQSQNQSPDSNANPAHNQPHQFDSANHKRANPSISTSGHRIEIQRSKEVKSRACDECRQRKTACYYLKGNDSRCFRCQMDGFDCTFEPVTKEKSLARPLSSTKRLTQGNKPGSGPIEDYSTLPGRSLLKKTLSLQHPRSSFAVGEYGLWDPQVLKSVPLDKTGQNRISSNLSLRKVAEDCLFVVRTEGGANQWTLDCDEIENVVAPYGRMLINCYFLWFHQSYPVLHEGIFIEKYTRTYRELTPALLGAVYLLALQYWYRSPELSTIARPPQLAPKLYELALSAFFKMSGGASLSLIQAGLLLLQCSYADGRHLSIASVMNSTAYRLALNRNCEDWKLPKWEICLRIRISWAVYSQSTWVSLIDSVPPLIAEEAWQLSPLAIEHFEGGGMSKPHSWLFTNLMKLSSIIRDVHRIRELGAPKAPKRRKSKKLDDEGPDDPDTQTVPMTFPVTSAYNSLLGAPASKVPASMEEMLNAVKPVQMRLKEWFQNLPESQSSVTNSGANLSLHLAYIAAESSLHHSIIRNLVAFKAVGHKIDPGLVAVCRSSAKDRLEAAMTLVNSITPRSMQSFWYFVSGYQFATISLLAALLYTTSEDESSADWYRTQISNYTQCLEALSEFQVMAAAVRTIRSSIAGIPGLDV